MPQQNTKQEPPRKVGRPAEKTEAREKLLFAARELFTVLSYEKVSTRMLAEKAGVNVAMIRYYFGNKEGLFETMVRETMEPIKKQVRQFSQEASQTGLKEVMRAYYKTMTAVPSFPKLIFQTMNMPPSELQRKLLEKVFYDITKPAQEALFNSKLWGKVIRPGMDPKLCKVTFLSLMVFPFIAPPTMYQLHGIKQSEEFFEQLLEHNMQVLMHGFMLPDQPENLGEDNEN